MPTDKELEQIALQRQFSTPDMRGTPIPTAQDALAYINRLRDVVPSVDNATPLTPTPTTSPLKGTAIPQKEEDFGELYHTIKDKNGEKITILSSNGELRSNADFGVALNNHDMGKPTPGFIIQPTGSYAEGIRKGLYQGTREALPQAGETFGGAIPSKMLELATKAGLISPQIQASATQTGANVGRTTADVIGQQVDTPGEAGMIAGTALAAPLAAPVISGAGTALKMNMLVKNPILFGTAGLQVPLLVKPLQMKTKHSYRVRKSLLLLL